MELQKFSRAVLKTVFCYLIFDHLMSLCSEPVKAYTELSFFLSVLYRNPVLAPCCYTMSGMGALSPLEHGNAVLFPIRRDSLGSTSSYSA